MDRALPPPQPQQQQQQQEQPMSLTELLEQLIADVADTTNNNNDDESGNDSVLITTVEARQRRRLIVVETMLRKELFPLRTRIKINDLIDDYHTDLQEDVHDMITDQRYAGEGYEGLDRDRDTIEEVTSIVRLVPEVLQKRKQTKWHYYDEDAGNEGIIGGEWVDVDDDDEGDYPIQCLSTFRDYEGNFLLNLKAVPFIHLFAQLAIEYNSFDENERGGLLIPGEYEFKNSMNNLVSKFNNSMENLVSNDWLENHSEDNCRRVDEIRSNELLRLRQMNLLTVDDIRELQLLSKLCRNYRIFPHASMRFFIEWSPNQLLLPSILPESVGSLPLHFAAVQSIPDFRFIFEYMIRYFPYKKGIALLFRVTHIRYPDRYFGRCAPFNLACDEFDQPQVMEVVEDVLAQVSGTTPINTIEAVVLAATDPNIQLDCLYFLIHRRPDVLLRSNGNSSGVLVPSSSRSKVNSSVRLDTNNDDADDDNDANIKGDGNDGGEEINHTKNHADTTTTTLKRKRSE